MRIIIASEQKSTRDAIGMLIRVQPDLELAGEAGDIVDLLAAVKAMSAALIVLDWDAFGKRIDTLLDLLELFESPPSIVAMGVQEEARADTLAYGLAGFACKGDPPDLLLETIRNAERGRPTEPERENRNA